MSLIFLHANLKLHQGTGKAPLRALIIHRNDSFMSVCTAQLRIFTLSDLCRLQFWFESVTIGHPYKPAGSATDRRLFPRECRERGASYTAPLRGRICRRVNDDAPTTIDVRLGDLPIMIRSSHCNLYGLSSRELVSAGEEANGVFLSARRSCVCGGKAVCV